MNGAFELICIFLAFIAVMIIFAALRSIQSDINEIYSRTYTATSSFDLIETLVRRLDAKVERDKVSAIAEAYEQGKKDAHIWTPTAESLPPLGTPVLTCDFTGYRSAMYLIKRDGVYRWQTGAGLRLYEDIVAWQKLPEPYKEECTGDSCPISYKD